MMMKCSITYSIFQQSHQSCIQPLTGPPPTPTTKTQHWQVAMYELQKYRQNINAMLEQMGGGKPYHLLEFDKTPKLAKEGKLLKPKDEKQGSNNGNSNGNTSNFDFPNSGDSMVESISSNQISVSNYIHSEETYQRKRGKHTVNYIC